MRNFLATSLFALVVLAASVHSADAQWRRGGYYNSYPTYGYQYPVTTYSNYGYPYVTPTTSYYSGVAPVTYYTPMVNSSSYYYGTNTYVAPVYSSYYSSGGYYSAPVYSNYGWGARGWRR